MKTDQQVRLECLHLAVNSQQAGGNRPEPRDVLARADAFYEWITREGSKPASARDLT